MTLEQIYQWIGTMVMVAIPLTIIAGACGWPIMMLICGIISGIGFIGCMLIALWWW